MNLALGLLMGGYPVIAYDPDSSIMERARSAVGGPVEFADSVKACAKQADVIVIASARKEFQASPAWLSDSKEQRRVVIDCCGMWQHEPLHPEIEYIAWAERS
jgi:UDP-glucose 6-dehydrogenase